MLLLARGPGRAARLLLWERWLGLTWWLELVVLEEVLLGWAAHGWNTDPKLVRFWRSSSWSLRLTGSGDNGGVNRQLRALFSRNAHVQALVPTRPPAGQRLAKVLASFLSVLAADLS